MSALPFLARVLVALVAAGPAAAQSTAVRFEKLVDGTERVVNDARA